MIHHVMRRDRENRVLSCTSATLLKSVGAMHFHVDKPGTNQNRSPDKTTAERGYIGLVIKSWPRWAARNWTPGIWTYLGGRLYLGCPLLLSTPSSQSQPASMYPLYACSECYWTFRRQKLAPRYLLRPASYATISQPPASNFDLRF